MMVMMRMMMSHVSSMQKRNKNMLLPNDVRGTYLNFKQAICHWLLGRAIMDIYPNACACIHTNTQIYNVSVSIPIYDYIFIYVLYIYMYDIIYLSSLIYTHLSIQLPNHLYKAIFSETESNA